MSFRYKRGIRLPQRRQEYIYAASRLYCELNPERQAVIRRLCDDAGGEYADALLEFVTTDASATALEMRHHVSKATLYRAVRRYYMKFPTVL